MRLIPLSVEPCNLATIAAADKGVVGSFAMILIGCGEGAWGVTTCWMLGGFTMIGVLIGGTGSGFGVTAAGAIGAGVTGMSYFCICNTIKGGGASRA